MKKTEAYIKPHKLTDVTMALRRVADLAGATVSLEATLREVG